MKGKKKKICLCYTNYSKINNYDGKVTKKKSRQKTPGISKQLLIYQIDILLLEEESYDFII